jgi:intein/homing endonuclease
MRYPTIKRKISKRSDFGLFNPCASDDNQVAFERLRAEGAIPMVVDMSPDEQPPGEILQPEIAEADERRQLAVLRDADKSMRDYVEHYITVGGAPFQFISELPGIGGKKVIHDRSYLLPLYEMAREYPQGSRNQVWCCGRQVEKSVDSSAKVLIAGGSWVAAKDITEGSLVIAVNEVTLESVVRPVTWKSKTYTKPGVRVTTRQGHTATFGPEHPLFIQARWVEARNVRVGDRIAVLSGYAIQDASHSDRDLAAARVLGWLVSEGSVAAHSRVDRCFHNADQDAVVDFTQSLQVIYPAASWRTETDRRRTVPCYAVHLHRETSRALSEFLPIYRTSFDQRVPPWIYSQGNKVRAEFLNRLWGGDGSCFKPNDHKYDITYTSVSKDLCRDLQALLWGFKIPTSIRSFVPTLYKGTGHVAWQIRVETQRGITRFLTEIGAFKKPLPLPTSVSNNNRDTLPIEAVQSDIDFAYAGVREIAFQKRGDCSLKAHGLRGTLKYPPTREKIDAYRSAFDAMGIDASALERWDSEDVFWDEVVSVEEVGDISCVDFTVEKNHTFIVEGLVTHNSTTQSAKSLVLGALFPAYQTLYVAPRFDQVTVFSSQRFKPMAEDSKPLWDEGLLRPSKTLWQVGAKELLNRSFYNFRSCYTTADGCRGITAQALLIDEIQDIISDNVPILEKCQAHWGWETGLRHRMYAGTPKTTNNTLTRRYRQSCQFEWIVRCAHCGFDNFLDEKVIGLKGYICTKCGGDIVMALGRWVPMNPAALDVSWGFRIPQMMVPYVTHADVLSQLEDPNISRLKFNNETLGLPYDEGELILTEAIMLKACEANRINMTPAQLGMIAKSGTPVFAGIDHGSAEGNSPSFTVLVMGTVDSNGRLQVQHITKFTGKLAALAPQPGILNQMLREAGVTLVFSDWGFGAHQNARLTDEFGWARGSARNMLAEVMYVSQRQIAIFDPVAGRYKVDRNQSMIACIDDIKMGRLLFFKADAMKPFVNDFTTIYTEYNDKYGTTKFDHKDPDDVFHATNLCRLAALTFRGQLVQTVIPDIGSVDPTRLGY